MHSAAGEYSIVAEVLMTILRAGGVLRLVRLSNGRFGILRGDDLIYVQEAEQRSGSRNISQII